MHTNNRKADICEGTIDNAFELSISFGITDCLKYLSVNHRQQNRLQDIAMLLVRVNRMLKSGTGIKSVI